MIPRKIVRAYVLCLTGLLSACSLLSQSQDSAPETFTLGLENTGPVALRAVGPVLVVHTPEAQQGLRTAQFAYTRRPYEIRYYNQHAWVEPPTRLLHSVLVQAMERTGLFGSVATPASGVVADVGLETQLLALQQEFTGESSRGRIALRAQLVDLGTRKVLASRDLDASEPVTSPGPYGGVTAINRALNRLMGELGNFVRDAMKPIPLPRR